MMRLPAGVGLNDGLDGLKSIFFDDFSLKNTISALFRKISLDLLAGVAKVANAIHH